MMIFVGNRHEYCVNDKHEDEKKYQWIFHKNILWIKIIFYYEENEMTGVLSIIINVEMIRKFMK